MTLNTAIIKAFRAICIAALLGFGIFYFVLFLRTHSLFSADIKKVKRLSKIWKADSLNCDNGRTMESLKTITQYLNTIPNKKDSIPEYLGNTSIVTGNDLFTDYCYYIGNGCYSTAKDNCYTCFTLDVKKDTILIDWERELCE